MKYYFCYEAHSWANMLKCLEAIEHAGAEFIGILSASRDSPLSHVVYAVVYVHEEGLEFEEYT